jgi:outer membrane lipoprotein LolB
MMRTWRSGFAALLAVLLVSGCVTSRPPAVPRATLPLSRADAEAALAALSNFSFEGRAAIRQRDKGVQASLSWAQRGEAARLRLSGPFGASAVRVALDEDGLSIEDSHGERLTGAQAEQLLTEQVGFPPPIALLRWWLRGLPAPNLPAEPVRDEAGRLTRLLQDGWQVEYLEYRDEKLAGALVALPRRLRATREMLDLRLVIDRWDLGK